MVEISTSVLTVEPKNAIQTFYSLEVAKTDYFHIDVMDGKFVTKDTVRKMKEYATTIKHISNVPLDVHLMVADVEKFIDDYSVLEPNIITFHYESNIRLSTIVERIEKIKKMGCRAGISIKPNTPLSAIYELLPMVHLVLIMSVEPGEGGQLFIPDVLDKISELKSYIDNNNLFVDIEVDGGINEATCEAVKTAGADVLVAGTAILKSLDYKTTIDILRSNL